MIPGRGIHHGLLRSGLDLLSFSAFALIVASCSPRANVANDVTVELTMTPAPAAVGGVSGAVLTLRDRARQPVRGATLRVEAYMSHPGMAPVIATPVERADAVYEAPLQFTMSGDWIVRVSGTLPDGRTVNQQIEIAVREASPFSR
jgi:hypothetical protein